MLSNILLDDLDKELERRGHAFCRYADDCNIYVRSRRAGERVMVGLSRFLAGRLRLAVNLAKSAVDRPWNRSFLGYSVTARKEPRLRVAAKSVGRLRDKLRDLFRAGRGRAIGRTVETLAPPLRGWIQYFRLAQTRGVFEELDGWLRRRLRCILWRQWKRPRTRAQRLMQRGLDGVRAWASANNGRGPWWNAGASHMNRCFPKDLLRAARADLPAGAAPPPKRRCMNRRIRNRTYGGVGGGRRKATPYPILTKSGASGHYGVSANPS